MLIAAEVVSVGFEMVAWSTDESMLIESKMMDEGLVKDAEFTDESMSL